MKIVKLACLATLAALTATASANAETGKAKTCSSSVSNCYYQYSYLSADSEVYDVYYCYSNGDGSY